MAVQAVAAPLSCEEILLRIESLEARERALQERLRRAPAWEKPAIVRMIVEVQLRIGALYAELETC